MRGARLTLLRAGTMLACAVLATVAPARADGSLLLVGGGAEDYRDWSDAPYRWLVERSGDGMVLVMHYSTASSFLPSYFRWLGASASENLVVSSRQAAEDSAVYRVVKEAGAVFLRGGDQWRYVSLWKGTLLEQALRELYEHGGAVGGTSAGMVVLSELVYDARITSVQPREALRDPLSAGISFTEDFLPFLKGSLLDSHFYERGRLGRLAAMIGLYRTQTGRTITGVGIDYHTALAVTPDGVGTVMGAGTVTVLRLTAETDIRLEPGHALGMDRVQLDQLTEGWAYNFGTGTVAVAPGAEQFHPQQPAVHGGRILLDGSDNPAHWSAEDGSIALLTGSLPRPSAVCLVTGDTAAPAVGQVRAELIGRNLTPVSLLARPALADNATAGSALNTCTAMLLLENTPDSLTGFLRAGTVAGDAFARAVTAGTPVAFLSDDAMLAGTHAVAGIESHIYAAYYGYMTVVPGTGQVTGVSVIPRLYEDPDYVDNRASACLWGLATSAQGVGLLLDEGSVAVLDGTVLTVRGATPAVVVDARVSPWVDFPSWRDPGKTHPRQNAALVDARLHIIRSDGALNLGPATDATLDPSIPPRGFRLDPAYPNPFNGTTQLTAHFERQVHATLTIVDLQGRAVGRLLDRSVEPGFVTIRWDARGFPSGVYFAWLQVADQQDVTRIALVR